VRCDQSSRHRARQLPQHGGVEQDGDLRAFGSRLSALGLEPDRAQSPEPRALSLES
jgi:hypothetical protein